MHTVNTVYSTLDVDTIRDLKMISQIDLIDSIPIEKRPSKFRTNFLSSKIEFLL